MFPVRMAALALCSARREPTPAVQLQRSSPFGSMHNRRMRYQRALRCSLCKLRSRSLLYASLCRLRVAAERASSRSTFPSFPGRRSR
jgi:hypothetical protein